MTNYCNVFSENSRIKLIVFCVFSSQNIMLQFFLFVWFWQCWGLNPELYFQAKAPISKLEFISFLTFLYFVYVMKGDQVPNDILIIIKLSSFKLSDWLPSIGTEKMENYCPLSLKYIPQHCLYVGIRLHIFRMASNLLSS